MSVRKTEAAPAEGGQGLRSRRSASELRHAIADAALTVFASKGYEGASTREIAATAGVEVGHLAYYFKTKEAMWTEVITAYAIPTHEWLKNRLAKTDLENPQSAARAVLPDLLRLFASNHRLVRLMLQDFSVASSRHARAVWEVGRPIWLHLRPLFEALQEKHGGTASDAKLAYFAMVGSIMVFFGSSPEVKEITGLDPADKAAAEDYIALVVSSVLRARPVKTSRPANKLAVRRR